MTSSLEDEVRRVLASMESEEPNEKEQERPGTTERETEPEETIHIHYFPDAIVILKEGEETPQPHHVVETTLAQTKKPPVFIGYAICALYLFLILSCIAFQEYEILNPPIATVTIIPKSQTVSLTGTLQLGRLLNPITLSQSQTVPTTGKGHQDAKAATGFITFYNGLFTSQTIQAGMFLTGTDGIQVVTDQQADIPAGNPPSYGQVTVSAHAINPGVRGNIPAYDINQACCSNAVLAKNTQPFSGGADERDFQTATKADIARVATPLKTALAHSTQGALQGQVKEREQLYILPCSPIVSSDHQIGEEARHITVTSSLTCSAIAYDTQALETKATKLLTSQALTKLGSGYSLVGTIRVTVLQATQTHNTPTLVLSFTGVWVYAISNREQQRIKRLITGETYQQAMHILHSLQGIEKVSIVWDENTKLPKDSRYIHLALIAEI